MARSAVIPVVIAVDFEPDGRGHRPPEPGAWPGALATHEWLGRQRVAAEAVTGRPVHFSWLLRMDAGMAEAYGSATHVVDVHPDLVADVVAHGDDLGIHVHGWRREPDGTWVDDLDDPGWLHDSVATALEAFQGACGRPCRLSRMGNRFLSAALIDQLAAADVEVDLTVEPASTGVDDGGMSHVRGPIPDQRRTPRTPHQVGPGLVELPLTASSKRLGLHPKAHLSRMRRHGIGQRLDVPLRLGRPMPPDDGFGARVQRSLRALRRPYLAFTVHSDGILDPDQRPRQLAHFDALLALPEAPRFAFVTPGECVSLLGHETGSWAESA